MELIIFDLDGTLAETTEDLLQALNRMLSDFRLPFCTKEHLMTFVNNGIYEFIRHALPEHLQNDRAFITQAIDHYEFHYSDCYSDKTHPYEGLPEVLCMLRKRGFRLAVLSNKQDVFVKRIISKLYPSDLFCEIHGQSVFPAKPDPQSVLAIAASLGIAPADCIYCGDSDVDMLTAKNAGMYPLGVSWGYRSPAFLSASGAAAIAADPLDLLRIVSAL